MSKLNVGQGFKFPDTTEQETAGVITDSQTAYFYSLSGDSALNGLSPEKAKATIQDAIDAANANPATLTTVNEAEGGVYIEDITLYDSVLFEGTQTAIFTTGLVGVTTASSQSFRPQALITNTDGATLVKTDGKTQFGLDARSIEINGDGCIGFDITGMCSGLFYTASEVRVSGANTNVVKYTGQSDIPSDFNFNTVILNGNGATFFEYDSSDPGDTVDVNISSLNSGPASGQSNNTCGINVKSGILKVRAGTISASMVVTTESGGIASVSANVIGGNTYAEGDVIYDTVGVIIGDLETTATGTVLWRGSSLTGDVTNAGMMSIKCDLLTGQITNTGTMYVQIGTYTGTLPVDDGSINGVINGIRYGNWKASDLGYILTTWGANIQTLGRHPAINSPSNAAEITSLGIMASIPVPASGTIDTIAYYNNTGDNTTEFQIIKNGVVMYTFTCIGPYGVETGINLPIGFVGSVPDNIAIRYSAGTAPSEGLYTAYIK